MLMSPWLSRETPETDYLVNTHLFIYLFNCSLDKFMLTGLVGQTDELRVLLH